MLDAKFEMSIRAGWSVGDRVQSTMVFLDIYGDPFDSEKYTGTIERMEPVPINGDYGRAEVLTPLSSFRVKWDGEEDPESNRRVWARLTEVSPWDLEFVDEQRQHLKSWQEECCSVTHRRNARRINEDGKQQLLAAIDRLMAGSFSTISFVFRLRSRMSTRMRMTRRRSISSRYRISQAM